MKAKTKLLSMALICTMILSTVPIIAMSANSGNSTNENNTAKATVTPTGTMEPTITPTTHNNAPIFTPMAADSNPENQTKENDTILPTVNFTANVTSGPAPLSVLFTSSGTGNPMAFNWSFGDGAYSNNNWTATHNYTQPGKYNVSVIVANKAGNNTSTKIEYINVSKAVVVNNRILCSGKAPLKVSFKDKSKKHIYSFWDIGDGTTAKSRYLLHVYKKPGKYPITLKYVTVGHVKKILHAGYILVK